MYVCQRETAKWVWIAFHQRSSAVSHVLASLLLSPHPCAVPPQAASACWQDADIVAASAHGTTPPCTLRRVGQPRTAWVADGACSQISPARETQSGQTWGRHGAFLSPVLSALGAGKSISPQAVPLITMEPLLSHTMETSTSSHHCCFISTPILGMNKQCQTKLASRLFWGSRHLTAVINMCKAVCSQWEHHHGLPLQPSLVSKSFEPARPMPGVWSHKLGRPPGCDCNMEASLLGHLEG